MKQFEPIERTINGKTFYIRPFPAFTASNVSGELFSAILPMIGSVAPMATNAIKDWSVSAIDADIDLDSTVPAIAKGLSGLSGDRVESLLKRLLVKYRNISVEMEGTGDSQPLTEDLANEVFCGNVQDMFILAAEVIRVNYSGFFERLGNLFGGHLDALRTLAQKKTPGPKSTES